MTVFNIPLPSSGRPSCPAPHSRSSYIALETLRDISSVVATHCCASLSEDVAMNTSTLPTIIIVDVDN